MDSFHFLYREPEFFTYQASGSAYDKATPMPGDLKFYLSLISIGYEAVAFNPHLPGLVIFSIP
jgi:hypothetical protein